MAEEKSTEELRKEGREAEQRHTDARDGTFRNLSRRPSEQEEWDPHAGEQEQPEGTEPKPRPDAPKQQSEE